MAGPVYVYSYPLMCECAAALPPGPEIFFPPSRW